MRQWVDAMLAALPGLLGGALAAIFTPVLPLGALAATFLITLAIAPRLFSAAAMLLAYGTGLAAAGLTSPAESHWSPFPVAAVAWLAGVALLWRAISADSDRQ